MPEPAMMVLAIDPGPDVSAWVLWDGERVADHYIERNHELMCRIAKRTRQSTDILVVEQVTSYGMPVGADVFETVFWSGRFAQAWRGYFTDDVIPDGFQFHRLPRRDVKLHLCQSARAKDSNVRQALLDRFGGEKAAKGSKAHPGPLYGLRKDEWQALALGVAWLDLHGAK